MIKRVYTGAPILIILSGFLLALAVEPMVAEGKQTWLSYSGNPKSLKYHNPKCRYFQCKSCTVRFSSAREAEKQGYVACKICGG